jgi:hypothetical protein
MFPSPDHSSNLQLCGEDEKAGSMIAPSGPTGVSSTDFSRDFLGE